jgi:cellulose 1,4-beta-cellobiosidase
MRLALFRRCPGRRGVTLVGVVALGAGLLAVTLPGQASAAATGCAVRYTATTFWGSGFQASVQLTPGNAVTNWVADFDLSDPQQVVAFTYNASFVQTGRHVHLTNASFNGTVPAGGSVTVGVGVHTNPSLSNVPVSGASVNGQVCTFTGQPYLMASGSNVVVSEGGSIGVSIRLSQAPPANIVLTTFSPTGFTSTPPSLTFTPANWNVAQTVTIASPEDADTTNQIGFAPVSQQNWVPDMQYTTAYIGVSQRDNDV